MRNKMIPDTHHINNQLTSNDTKWLTINFSQVPRNLNASYVFQICVSITYIHR